MEMLSDVKVSVVIPVCNVEQYVEQCVKSIMSQTLKEIEIICVNDGSTDGSLAILNKLARSDARIKVIDKQNTGYGDTVNRGIAAARGEYIGIVESDDFAEIDMYEKLYTAANKYQAEVVKGNYNDYFTASDEKRFNEYLKDVPYECVLRDLETIYFLGPAIWSGIYKKDFLLSNGIEILNTPGASYQDVSFIFKVMLCAKRAVFIPDALLNYRNDNSNSSINDTKKVFCICNEFEEIKNFIEIKGKKEILPVYVKTKYLRYRWNLERLEGKQKNKFLIKMFQEFQRHNLEGNIIRKYWNDEEWFDIHKMLYDFDKYRINKLENIIEEEQNLYVKNLKELLSNIDELAIYGAGKRSKRIVNILQRANIHIKYMIVSNKNENPDYVENIPVIALRDADDIGREALIVIGVASKYEKEVTSNLQRYYLCNYITIDDNILNRLDISCKL